METQKKRAARCNRATPARKSSDPEVKGSRTQSIARRRRLNKHKIRRLALTALLLAVIAGTVVAIAALTTAGQSAVAPPATAEPPATAAPTSTPTEAPEAHYDEASDPTFTGYPEAPAPRYPLSDNERDVVERVVMAEAGGESFEGQMLVAQCILNAAEKEGTEPSEAVVIFRYTSGRPEPTQSVRDAVAAVFDDGETVTDEPILYFYNPARVTSTWHESQIFVTEVGGHRFFAERSQ